MWIPRNHPYWHVRGILFNNKNIASATLSYYHYIPQSISDDRHTFKIERNNFLDEHYVAEILNSGPYESELAIHSNVQTYTGEEFHIPMIDMSTPSRAHLLKLRPYIGDDSFSSFSWFSSGRSFHGYGSYLVNHAAWTQLMGILLLANQKDMKPLVDPRWIGHRLLAGYSALRWTKRTSYYINTPTHIENIYSPNEGIMRDFQNSRIK